MKFLAVWEGGLAYFLIFFILLSVVYKNRKKNTRNGAIFGAFLVLVFVSRILVEFVKTPQAAYPAAFWLDTGQMLSIPFVLAGMVFLVNAFRNQETDQPVIIGCCGTSVDVGDLPFNTEDRRLSLPRTTDRKNLKRDS